MSTLRIAMLHLAPRLGDVAYNYRVLEMALHTAAALGADWVLTPELCLCGYQFRRRLGTEWILSAPDAWVEQVRQMAMRLHLTVFLSHPEREAQGQKLYNTVFVLGADGALLGTHRKVHVVPVAEDWSSRGDQVVPIYVPPVPVGILICADAYTPPLARHLQAQGAALLVSAAAWGPWPHGPHDAWEQRTIETGLPLFVCNRTGSDDTLNFDDAESVVVKDGKRLLAFRSPQATMLLVEWDLPTHRLLHQQAQPLALP